MGKTKRDLVQHRMPVVNVFPLFLNGSFPFLLFTAYTVHLVFHSWHHSRRRRQYNLFHFPPPLGLRRLLLETVAPQDSTTCSCITNLLSKTWIKILSWDGNHLGIRNSPLRNFRGEISGGVEIPIPLHLNICLGKYYAHKTNSWKHSCFIYN